jgi:acyl carrier protein
MKKTLLQIINEVLDDKIHDINFDMDLRDDIGFDSLKLAHLTVLIEDECGVDVFESGLVRKVSDIIKKTDGKIYIK